MSGTQVVKAICALCGSKCAIDVHIKNNQLIKITTDETSTRESNLKFGVGAS